MRHFQRSFQNRHNGFIFSAKRKSNVKWTEPTQSKNSSPYHLRSNVSYATLQMTNSPKPDLSDHEEEATPFDDVLRKLLTAKPAPRSASDNQAQDKPPKAK